MESASFLYDGSLLTSDTRTGTLNAALSWTYDADMRPSTFTYAGGTVSFGYDNDSLLTSASGFTIGRDAANGLPLTVSDPAYAFDLTRTFSGYGEVDGVGCNLNGTAPYSWSATRDDAGRIVTRTETLPGQTIAWAYRYDEVGRLVEVKKDGLVVESYGYDGNGNRLSEGNLLRGISRTLEYDLEDKVITAGTDSYAFDVDGFLTSRVTAEGLATFDYSSRGELLSASLPAYGATVARAITYTHDPMGRRLAKAVNGVTVEKYLWTGATTLLAVYDGGGALRDRYLYADGRLPVRLDRGGARYYLLTDQVGTVRAVADWAGTIVKRIDYDSFGNILFDSNPAFPLPFGFAGGLHDRDTGLVRFGARDYDPAIGRWTAKDPIDFAGGDENLGNYCAADPANKVDTIGTAFISLSMSFSAPGGKGEVMYAGGGTQSSQSYFSLGGFSFDLAIGNLPTIYEDSGELTIGLGKHLGVGLVLGGAPNPYGSYSRGGIVLHLGLGLSTPISGTSYSGQARPLACPPDGEIRQWKK